jgi:undecaprenyl diphosphate synthase
MLDGNRRWAKANGLSIFEGHSRGLDHLRDVTRWVKDAGVQHLVVYAFSTENWKRAPEEVSHLMSLVLKMAKESLKDLVQDGVRVRFIGERSRLPKDVQRAIGEIEEESRGGAFSLWVCASYGGRAEIVEAARAMQLDGEDITEASFRRHLWSAEMPDPDIIIRTGGAKRLSNFLTWQTTYSELFFIDTFWPDFSEAELKSILSEYGERERRLGR